MIFAMSVIFYICGLITYWLAYKWTERGYKKGYADGLNKRYDKYKKLDDGQIEIEVKR